jgi:hypothetical protein
MPKDDLLYFGNMLDIARGARAAMEGVSREAFDLPEAPDLSAPLSVLRS